MKYIKPLSLTWWAAASPLLAGTFIAATPMHGLADLAQTVSTMYGDVHPVTLINSGLFGIGIRAAPGVDAKLSGAGI